MKTKTEHFWEFSDIIDNIGRIYILMLFCSGALWAFIAVNNLDTPNIFRIALIYSLLLIFGLLGVAYDKSTHHLGIDSRIWHGKNLNKQLALGVIVLFIWYLIFMRAGFSVASAAVSGTVFSLSPSLNFMLTNVLGPLAENIFFFGMLNITLVMILRNLIQQKSKAPALVAAALIFLSKSLFSSVPNSGLFLTVAAALIAVSVLTQNKFLLAHAPFIASALFIGAVVFPKFHSYAFRLEEKYYISASWFGVICCILVSYIGLFPVDIVHWGNNIIVAITGP